MHEYEMNTRARYYFGECARIPHGSNHEKELSDYIVSFAKKNQLSVKQDEMYNVIIMKPASAGYENAPMIMLQAHMDMVCEKNKDVNHDFLKDPLDLYVDDNNILHARGTTLGADDCQGVAYMLAILEDQSLKHPALQCIFTVQEETGLHGALALRKEDVLGKRLISLDGSGETKTEVSSSGGCYLNLSKQITWENNELPTYRLSVRGLQGGHSGAEIHKERGNANIIAARVLQECIMAGIDINLISMEGGMKGNAIPREADIIFAASHDFESLKEKCSQIIKDIKTELEFSDAGIAITVEQIDTQKRAMTNACTKEILQFMYIMPYGLQHRSMAIPGLTLTSLNPGVVQTNESSFELICSIRSALTSGIEHVKKQLILLADLFHFEYQTHAAYPAWAYKEKSILRNYYNTALQEIDHVELKTEAVHGGLEAGVFAQMDEDMDIITLGPVCGNFHTPGEWLDLESFDRTYNILTRILEIAIQ